MGRFTDDDTKKSSANDVEASMEELSVEDPLHDDDIAHKVRSILQWQVPRDSYRIWWWIGLGGIFVVALLGLVGFVSVAGKVAREDEPLLEEASLDEALLDTVLNETLGFQKIFVINLKKQTDRKDRLLLAADQSGIKVEFMEAIGPNDVDRTAIPWTGEGLNTDKMSEKVFASWRSHVNAVQAIIDQNLGSALILEDDTDWDVRIKDQLRDWAQTSQQLVQPLERDHDLYLDPTYYKSNSTKYNSVMDGNLRTTEWNYKEPPEAVLKPTESAYGDLARWDILWLGHCGAEFAHPGSGCYKTPLGRVVHMDDETVAETQWFGNWLSGKEYANTYDNHTRVTHWSCAQVCNTAYAVSNQGARKLLYDYGIRVFRGMSDTILRMVCDGQDPYYELRTCLSVSPPLFNQYKMDHGKLADTSNIRLSIEANLAHLVNGDEELKDLWEDGKNKTQKAKELEAAAKAAKEAQEAAKKAVKEAAAAAVNAWEKEEAARIAMEKEEAARLENEQKEEASQESKAKDKEGEPTTTQVAASTTAH